MVVREIFDEIIIIANPKKDVEFVRKEAAHALE